jgi:hypothetical protein
MQASSIIIIILFVSIILSPAMAVSVSQAPGAVNPTGECGLLGFLTGCQYAQAGAKAGEGGNAQSAVNVYVVTGNDSSCSPGACNGSKWWSSDTDPTGDLGSDDDYFLNTASYDIFNKTGGAWQLLMNIKGATGAAGPVGAAGPAGPTGPMNQTFNLTANMTAGPQGPPGEITISGALDMQDYPILNLGPAINQTDAVNKSYVDGLTAGGGINGTLVSGPTTSTADRISLADGTTGRLIKYASDTIDTLKASLLATVSTWISQNQSAIDARMAANLSNTSTQLNLRETILNSTANATQQQIAIDALGGGINGTLVSGPTSSTDGRIALSDGVNGRLIKYATDTIDSLKASLLASTLVNETADRKNLSSYKVNRANLTVKASEMYALATGGATETGVNETATNHIPIISMNYPPITTTKGVGATGFFIVPGDFSGTGFYTAYLWSAKSGLATHTINWTTAMSCECDDGATDTAWGTNITTTDSLITIGDMHISPWSTLITPGGTIGPGCGCYFMTNRTGSGGSGDVQSAGELIGQRFGYVPIA